MEDLAWDVLVIEHESVCPAGVVATVLERSGLDMHLFQPHLGQQLPEDLSGYEGMVVLGGGWVALAVPAIPGLRGGLRRRPWPTIVLLRRWASAWAPRAPPWARGA